MPPLRCSGAGSPSPRNRHRKQGSHSRSTDAMDVRPGSATTVGILLLLAAVPGVAAQEREDEGPMHELSEKAATPALVLLGVAVATAGWNLFRRRYLFRLLRGRSGAIKSAMVLHRRVLLPVHALTGAAALVVGAVHGWYAEEQYPLAWLGMVGMGVLVLGGTVLMWKWPPAKFRKGVYVLHSQQLVLLATLALLWIGHLVGD